MAIDLRFEYGEKVREIVTGVTGKVTGFAHYYGTQQDMYLIAYKNKNDSFIEDWIHENRLEKA